MTLKDNNTYKGTMPPKYATSDTLDNLEKICCLVIIAKGFPVTADENGLGI